MTSLTGFNNAVKSVRTAFNDLGNKFETTASSVVEQVGSRVKDISAFTNTTDIISSIRRGSLPVNAESVNPLSSVSGPSLQSNGNDWRVRISLPSEITSFMSSSLLRPLVESGRSMVFPTTPQVMVAHSANYSNVQPVHTNYPFPAYESSQVEDITITSEWPVENEADGSYWIGSVHFLRSVTKMFYGGSTNRGAPPPVVYLSGYGDFVFNNMPVVVTLFSLDLNDGVDYIKVPIPPVPETVAKVKPVNVAGSSYSYVPALSRLSITVKPVFSRNETSKFSLDKFVNGDYVGRNDNMTGGFM